MAGIPDDLIEEIRAQADIVQIIGEHMPLRRVGRTYRGPCPLHGGEHPNFSVDPQRGLFKCFVCGAGGDVFAFPMKRFGLSFVDAVRYVADRTGIPVPESSAAPEQDPYRDLREAVAFAADWYRRQLWESADGEAARRYLERRDVARTAAERFGLGYAPPGWHALRDVARGHGISDDVLERAGLVKQSEKAKEPYDHFRHRLLFPIEDLRGRPVGFGGRALVDDPEVPKYLNSPDTRIFHKGRLLYGLSWSRGAIRREGVVLVVEGYLDYVSLAARGIENVVAPLGTALTPDQARLLSRYAKRAILLYDSDAPGLRATFRAGDEFLRAGVHPHVATLPPGQDPDSLVRQGGPLALKPFLDAAVDLLERKIEILSRRRHFESIRGRRRAVDVLLPTAGAAADEALRDLYLDRLARLTGVRRETLEQKLRGGPRWRAPTTPAGGLGGAGGARGVERVGGEWGEEAEAGPPRLGPERKILLLLLRDETLVARVAKELESEDFEHPAYRQIYVGLRQSTASGTGQGTRWAEVFPAEVLELLHELLDDPEELTDPEAVLRDSVARLRARRLHRRLDELNRRVATAPVDEGVKLAAEIQTLRRALAELGTNAWRGFWAR